MQGKTKRTFIGIAGIVFLLLGIVGLALPFLQGFLFIAIGLVLLSIAFPGLRLWIEEKIKPFPKVQAFMEKADAWVRNVIGEDR